MNMTQADAHEGRSGEPISGDVSEDAARPLTTIDAQADIAGAASARDEILAAMARGPVRVDLSEGKPTQPAIQVLVAVRNSARAGQDVVFADAAETFLETVIEEGMQP